MTGNQDPQETSVAHPESSSLQTVHDSLLNTAVTSLFWLKKETASQGNYLALPVAASRMTSS